MSATIDGFATTFLIYTPFKPPSNHPQKYIYQENVRLTKIKIGLLYLCYRFEFKLQKMKNTHVVFKKNCGSTIIKNKNSQLYIWICHTIFYTPLNSEVTRSVYLPYD